MLGGQLAQYKPGAGLSGLIIEFGCPNATTALDIADFVALPRLTEKGTRGAALICRKRNPKTDEVGMVLEDGRNMVLRETVLMGVVRTSENLLMPTKITLTKLGGKAADLMKIVLLHSTVLSRLTGN